MTATKYAVTPMDTKGMPPGIPYIIGNELAERFSFYGMKAILTVFMTKHLLDSAGQPDFMNDEEAKTVYHLFTAAAYFFPILGAILSDVLWGKYKTILLISLMYCLGHGMLALMDLGPVLGAWDMKPFLYIGLLLIAVGAGGIKPCVSAHVGDQFGPKNQHLISKTFSWFYFSINVGAATSTLLTPVFLVIAGPWLAFGVPGVLMAMATFLFWLGRNKFVHIPPSGWKSFKEETFSHDGRRALINLAPLFLLFIPMFWAIFDQTGSAWVLQAESMDRRFLGLTWLESQVQAVNPVLILILIPTFAYGIYPLMGKFFKVTPLRKIGIGLFLTAGAFAMSALIELAIEAQSAGVAQQLHAALGGPAEIAATDLSALLRAATAAGWEQAQIQPYMDAMPNIGWQFLAYIALTAAEVMVSITSLEFAYTQAPKRMKSFIMGVYFLGVSLGNLFTAGVNKTLDLTKDDSGATPLDGANYYWFFVALMLVVSVIYVVFAKNYKGATFVQGDGHDDLVPVPTDADARRAEAEGPDAR
ncbi:MAG: POT family MFS transporter [Phycisphaerales bacterium]